MVEDNRIFNGAMKCRDIRRNTMAKAIIWTTTDAEVRKHEERMGLETPVVHAVNDEY